MGRSAPAERFFSRHAADYSRSTSHAYGSDLSALIKALKPRRREVALDVATGTGFTAIALAKRVGHVTGVDVTDEMLWQARMIALKQGVTNVRFERGDALNLNFQDSSFDIVTTRRATHHFSDVAKFLQEARRVLRPGGRLGIVDMSPPAGAEDFSNKIENLRDRSHVEAFTPKAWNSMVLEAGFRISLSSVLDEKVNFDRWLYPVERGGHEEKAIRLAWKSAPTKVVALLRADVKGSKVRSWTKSRIVLVASKQTS